MLKKFTGFCQALKKMRTKENWFLFSASLCRRVVTLICDSSLFGVSLRRPEKTKRYIAETAMAVPTRYRPKENSRQQTSPRRLSTDEHD